MGIRKEFERLDEIKRKLISVNFNESLNRYESKNPTLIECFETALWLNGAWYAFQEQQKIIDIQECGATEILMIIGDSEYDDSTKIKRIKDLLK